MNERVIKDSQDEYCRGCILKNVCNVILKDGEVCGDRVEQDKSFKFEYFVGEQFTK